MAATDLENRLTNLESMFSTTTLTGLCPGLEKKIHTVIKQYLTQLESRTIALTDSKVDAADCYLKLKAKVEKTDFEKMLDQFLGLRKRFDEVVDANETLKKEMHENEVRHNNEIKSVQEKMTDVQNETQEQFQRLTTELATRDFSRGGFTTKTIDHSEEIKELNESLKRLQSQLDSLVDRLTGFDKTQSASQNSLLEAKDAITQLKENLQKTTTKSLENNDKILNLKPQLTSINTTLEEHKNQIQQCKKLIEKGEEKAQDLENALDQIRKKYSVLESKHVSLASELADRGKTTNGIEKDDAKKVIEMGEEIRTASTIILKENAIIRKQFGDARNILEGELQRLRSENELLLKEYERMYDRNREIEATFNKLKDECKHLAEMAYKNTVMYHNKTRELFNASFIAGGNTTVLKTGYEKQPSKDLTWYLPKQPEESTKAAHRINVRSRRFKDTPNLSNVSEYLNKSSIERFGEIDLKIPEKRSTTAHTKSGEKVVLNRFKMFID